jgi:GNAT superfamily N-acetyltransferase
MTRLEIRAAARPDLRVLEAELPANPPWAHLERLVQAARGEVSYLVAWLGRRPVGSAAIHWRGAREPAIAVACAACPEIFALGVAPDLTSEGVGSSLLAALEALARSRGFPRVGLGVGFENTRARELYLRLGYREAIAREYIDRFVGIGARGERVWVEDRCVFLAKELRGSRSARP